MAFVRNIGMHPETWLDFPLFDEFEDTHDFEMSDAQQEHALAVESLDRRLAALKIELCPNHMTEGCFWKIYFILLHSRLNKHDAELLLTPQIAEARAMLFQMLQGKTKADYEPSSRSLPYRNIDTSSVSAGEQVASPSEINPTKLYPLEGPISEDEIIGKPVIKEDLATESMHKDLACNFSEISIHDYDDNDDDEWLNDESGDISGTTFMPFGNEEDVSFSDLEDEDEPRASSSSKTATYEVNTSASSAFSSNRSDR
ncbi:uncharacterized protein LOC109822439 [Asparagus officinalis]|uniref:uncharacterized protein LOC109822439 n=1 Tax=Asparagus officinalis TaxID=4686 RepID=UPI00098E25CC|nr:uncharacterized protein LOC109822439 [Asparagus officinalis]